MPYNYSGPESTSSNTSTHKPRVSIGIPVYNGETYIELAIRSVLAQTFSDFELIISDNASTDKTREICEAYVARDDRIRYYRNETNVGAAPNFNRVFELSSGEYFKWAAYDDLIAPEYLDRCVNALDQNPDFVMCYPRTILIDKHGAFMCNYDDNFFLVSEKPHERFRDFFKIGNMCHPIFGLMRTSIFKNTSLLRSFTSADRALLGELALIGKVYEVPERLAYRRRHPGDSIRANKSHLALTRWFDPNAKTYFLTERRRFIFEYIRIINRVKLNWHETALCYRELLRHYLRTNRFKRRDQVVTSSGDGQ